MYVVGNPSTQSATEPHPERPSNDAVERLIGGIRNSLVVDRQIVTVGDLTLRFLRRDEVFAHEGDEFQALEAGIFSLATWTRSAGEGKPAQQGTKWMRLASSDDLDVLLTPHLMAMHRNEAEGLLIGLAASKVLTQMNARRRPLRP